MAVSYYSAYIFNRDSNSFDKKQFPKKSPPAKHVLIKNKAVGVSFAQEEFISGNEIAGVIEAIGDEVKNFKIGERVAAIDVTGGSYAEYSYVLEDALLKLPEDISDEAAVTNLSKGMVAHLLFRRTFFLQAENIVVIHDAAGGLGSLLCRLANHYGANYIMTAGSDEEISYVTKFSTKNIINYNKVPKFSKLILDFTKGKGADAVFDSLGLKTFEESIKSLGYFGLIVSFGNFSGGIPKFNPALLKNKSAFITFPEFSHYKNNKIERNLSASEVFHFIRKKIFSSKADKVYNLDQILTLHENIKLKQNIGIAIIKL